MKIAKAQTIVSVTWKYRVGDLVNINTTTAEADYNPWVIQEYAVYSELPFPAPLYVLDDAGTGFDVEDLTFHEWALDLVEARGK